MVKRLKDTNAPKRPLSAYLQFGSELRKKNASISGMPVGDQGKLVAEGWKNLNEKDRSVYEEKYKREKAMYDEELEAYKKTDNYLKFQEELSKFKEDAGKGKKKKKTRKNVSAYNVFFKDCHAELLKKKKDLPMSERTTCIAKMWKEIDEATKEKYKLMAEEKNKTVKIEESN